MALTTNLQNNSGGIINLANGQVVTDAGAAANTTLNLGFSPSYVRWQNLTDRITLEWFAGMAANTALRTVAAGTITLDVSSGITVTGDNDLGQPESFMINAADIPASKTFAWIAQG